MRSLITSLKIGLLKNWRTTSLGLAFSLVHIVRSGQLIDDSTADFARNAIILLLGISARDATDFFSITQKNELNEH